jgi:hypothetical protein
VDVMERVVEQGGDIGDGTNYFAYFAPVLH